MGWLVLAACNTACGGHALPSDATTNTGGASSSGGSTGGEAGSSSAGGSSGAGSSSGGTAGGGNAGCSHCDSDDDGLLDPDEIAAGLDPFDADTDDDGLLDGDEDYDHDGVVDADETNPKEADSDGDGNCDGWRDDVDGDGRKAQGCEAGEVLLVDCSAEPSPTRDGRTWSTAYAHPQDALDRAHSGQQLWLRRGTCRPQAFQDSVVTVGSTEVSLHGGFLGTERSFAARITPPEGTALDGDVLANDIDSDPSFGRTDDSRHVVRIFSGAHALLDGLHLRHGFALSSESPDDTGAGVLADLGVTLSVRDLRCTDNIAVDGGCLAMLAGTLDARRVVFENNRGMGRGGAIYLHGTSLELTTIEASSNEAVNGGALAFEGGHGTVRDAVLRSNLVAGEGGAILLVEGEWQIENAECGDNEAAWGGAIVLHGGHLSLQSALIHSNQSEGDGGGIYAENGDVTLLRAALVGNTSRTADGGALYANGGSSTLLHASCVGNTAAGVGGCVTTDGSLSVRSSELRNNHAAFGGGAVQFHGSVAEVINSTVMGNSSESAAALAFVTGNVQLSHLSVAGNHAVSPGAGIIDVLGGTTRIDNSLLWGSGPNDTSLVVTSSFGALLGQGNCAPAPLAALCQASALLTSLPLGCEGDGGDCPARADNPCVDAGSDERAFAVGFDSDGLSTTVLGADEGAIDAGYHYATDEARITSFTATANAVSYETVNASSCKLLAQSDGKTTSRTIANELLASGSLPHDVSAGALHLVCADESGRPKAASFQVGDALHAWLDKR
jgi:predicted outer membrane repeat protein